MDTRLWIGALAERTGVSTHVLRVWEERYGLLTPERSPSGYRIYGPAELQRLRTLRELLDRHGLGPSDVAFAKRMRNESELEDAVAPHVLPDELRGKQRRG